LAGLEFHTADTIFRAALEEIRRIEAKYSRYLPGSVLSQINATAFRGDVALDEETSALIDYAALCYQQSGGLFDITSGVLRRAWNFATPRIPSPDSLQPLLELVGWKKVRWNKPTIAFSINGMELDLGGIGKEYAVDRAVQVLVAHGVSSALVNLGGDVRAIGCKPNREPWQIGLTHPRERNKTLGVVSLQDCALATSGDYERYFEVDGKRYCHLLNPRTGYPVNGFQAVSILAPTCLVAGTASTMTMLKEDYGLPFVRALGLAHLLVQNNGEILNHEFALRQNAVA